MASIERDDRGRYVIRGEDGKILGRYRSEEMVKYRLTQIYRSRRPPRKGK